MFSSFPDFFTGYSQPLLNNIRHCLDAVFSVLFHPRGPWTAKYPACLAYRNPFHKVPDRRPADGVSPGRCNPSGDRIPPSRQELDSGTRSFTEYQSQPDIGPSAAKNSAADFKPSSRPLTCMMPETIAN